MMMVDLVFVLRLLHLLAGLGWVGEVLTVNFVLLPTLRRVDPQTRAQLLILAFPLVFQLATVLGGLAVLSGLGLFLLLAHGHPLLLVTTAWGHRILIGGFLGGGLYLFHLFQESRAEQSLAAEILTLREHDDPVRLAALFRHLEIFPRVGLGILLVAVGFMSAAARLP